MARCSITKAVFVCVCLFSSACKQDTNPEPTTSAAPEPTPPPAAAPAAPETRVRVAHGHGMGACEGYLFISANAIRYEDSIRPAAGPSHGFSCATKDLQKFELVDNSKGKVPGNSVGYWLNMTCPPLNNLSLVFSGPPADAKQDFLRTQQARAGKDVAPEPARPEISAETKAAGDRANYVKELFEITSDPRYPGTEQFKLLLVPTADFKNKLVGRKLVGALNRLYGWNLSEDGKWTTKQANDVMFDIVAKPNFEVEKALAAIAANRKP